MSKKTLSHFAEYNLAQWLSYIEEIHNTEIDMGLTRIGAVLAKLSIDFNFAKVVTVSGTNGKGTTCAFMENALLSEGKSVAVYSSPHIERFNERLRIDKMDVNDTDFIDAFYQIEAARGNTSLTYYEFTTLAAFVVLMAKKPDIIILEVGLGGRLDATNVIDADIAVITTIDLDHQAFLGNTRELIAIEKAGIMRKGRLAVIGDKEPPETLTAYVEAHQVNAYSRSTHFKLSAEPDSSWSWQSQQYKLQHLQPTAIPQDNVATGLMTLSLLNVVLEESKVNHWIAKTKVPGRTEIFVLNEQEAKVMLDVGHNPQAARYLNEVLGKLLAQKQYNKVHGVIGMLKDKDIETTFATLNDNIDNWYIGSLSAPRAATASEICQLAQIVPTTRNCFDNVTEAFKMARQCAEKNDLILVCGSFFTVAEIRRTLVAC